MFSLDRFLRENFLLRRFVTITNRFVFHVDRLFRKRINEKTNSKNFERQDFVVRILKIQKVNSCIRSLINDEHWSINVVRLSINVCWSINAFIDQYSNHWQIISFIVKSTCLLLLFLFRKNFVYELKQFAICNRNRFIQIHQNSLMFIQIHWCSFKFIEIHSNSLMFIQIHWCSFKFIDIYSNSLMFIQVHWCSLKFIDAHLNSLMFIQIHWNQWSFAMKHALCKHDKNFVTTTKNLRKKFRCTISTKNLQIFN